MSVEDKIIEIVAGQALVDPDGLTMVTTLQELGIDSMGVVECIFAIEEEFDIQVPFNANDPKASDFDISSVQSITSAVKGLIADKNA